MVEAEFSKPSHLALARSIRQWVRTGGIQILATFVLFKVFVDWVGIALWQELQLNIAHRLQRVVHARAFAEFRPESWLKKNPIPDYAELLPDILIAIGTVVFIGLLALLATSLASALVWSTYAARIQPTDVSPTMEGAKIIVSPSQGLKSIMAHGLNSWPSVFFLNLAIALGALFLALFLVVPGVVFGLGMFLAGPVIVIEQRSLLGAMRRSWQVLRGYKAYVAVHLFVLVLIVGVGHGMVAIMEYWGGISGHQHQMSMAAVASSLGIVMRSALEAFVLLYVWTLSALLLRRLGSSN